MPIEEPTYEVFEFKVQRSQNESASCIMALSEIMSQFDNLSYEELCSVSDWFVGCYGKKKE